MTDSAYSLPNLTKISHYGFATLYQNNITGEKSLHATVSYKAGDVFSKFEAAEILTAPNKYTVQINDETHIILDPECVTIHQSQLQPECFF